MKTLLGMAVLVSLGMMALGVYSAFSSGYVLAKLWEWYAVPLGYHALDWKVFAAVMLALGVIRGVQQPNPKDKKPETSDAAATLIVAALTPWFMLLVGWFLKS